MTARDQPGGHLSNGELDVGTASGWVSYGMRGFGLSESDLPWLFILAPGPTKDPVFVYRLSYSMRTEEACP